jgi:hypothetical protein
MKKEILNQRITSSLPLRTILGCSDNRALASLNISRIITKIQDIKMKKSENSIGLCIFFSEFKNFTSELL